MARNGMDTYRVGYKKFTTPDDKKLGTINFERGSCNVEIKATNHSNAGMAQKKFLSGLPAGEKKRTVVTGAIIF